jgi:hypothetical protein
MYNFLTYCYLYECNYRQVSDWWPDLLDSLLQRNLTKQTSVNHLYASEQLSTAFIEWIKTGDADCKGWILAQIEAHKLFWDLDKDLKLHRDCKNVYKMMVNLVEIIVISFNIGCHSKYYWWRAYVSEHLRKKCNSCCSRLNVASMYVIRHATVTWLHLSSC